MLRFVVLFADITLEDAARTAASAGQYEVLLAIESGLTGSG